MHGEREKSKKHRRDEKRERERKSSRGGNFISKKKKINKKNRFKINRNGLEETKKKKKRNSLKVLRSPECIKIRIRIFANRTRRAHGHRSKQSTNQQTRVHTAAAELEARSSYVDGKNDGGDGDDDPTGKKREYTTRPGAECFWFVCVRARARVLRLVGVVCVLARGGDGGGGSPRGGGGRR